MDVIEKLRQWGIAHGEARAAEREAARDGAEASRLQARQLRDRADRLHGEIYRELDGGRARAAAERPAA